MCRNISYIRHPYLVWLLRIKVPVKYIFFLLVLSIVEPPFKIFSLTSPLRYRLKTRGIVPEQRKRKALFFGTTSNLKICFFLSFALYLFPQKWRGVRVWLKEHAWKACVQQCTEGSNPSLSVFSFSPSKNLYFSSK